LTHALTYVAAVLLTKTCRQSDRIMAYHPAHQATTMPGEGLRKV
jgi:hypothetical protein